MCKLFKAPMRIVSLPLSWYFHTSFSPKTRRTEIPLLISLFLCVRENKRLPHPHSLGESQNRSNSNEQLELRSISSLVQRELLFVNILSFSPSALCECEPIVVLRLCLYISLSLSVHLDTQTTRHKIRSERRRESADFLSWYTHFLTDNSSVYYQFSSW